MRPQAYAVNMNNANRLKYEDILPGPTPGLAPGLMPGPAPRTSLDGGVRTAPAPYGGARAAPLPDGGVRALPAPDDGFRAAPAPDGADGGDLLLREYMMRKTRNKVRRKYVLMIFVSFIFAVALIYRYSLVIEINDRILREKAALAQIENENSLALKQIGTETDLEKVRILAESRLGMQKPDKDQIRYIKVPRRDHALVAAPAQPRDPGALNPFAYMLDQIKLIRKRLFAN